MAFVLHRYRKAYEDYARALHQEYPDIKFHGETFHPGDFKVAVAQMLQLGFFAGIAIAMVAKRLLPQDVQKLIDDHPMPSMIFICSDRDYPILTRRTTRILPLSGPSSAQTSSCHRSYRSELRQSSRKKAVMSS